VNALSRAEKGSWYSYRHRAWFTAPLVKPPHDVRIWPGWKPTLELAADGEADNIDGVDMPSTPLEYSSYEVQGTRYTVPTTPEGGAVALYQGISYQVPCTPTATHPDGWRVKTHYDETLHRRIWDKLPDCRWAIKPTQAAADMDGEGGDGFYLVREIRKLGRAGKLPWQE